MIDQIHDLRDQLSECENLKSGLEEKFQSHKKKWKADRVSLVEKVNSLQKEVDSHIEQINLLTSKKLSLEKSLKEA